MSIRGLFRRMALALVLVTMGAAMSGRVAAQAAGSGNAISPEDEEKARAHFRLGRAYYDNGDFAKAAVEFESAYKISQRAALLYNIYLAYRDASDTRHAADALRKYLELEKKIENRGQLESRLAALDRSLAEEAATQTAQPVASAPKPTPAPAAQATAAQATTEVTAPPVESDESAPAEATQASEPSGARPLPILPIALMGTGGAMVIGSVITGVITLGKKSELSDARDQCEMANNCQSLSPERAAELESIQSSGKTLAVVTDVLLFGGLAVAGTGAVLFFLQSGSQEQAPPATTASLACAPGACLGSLRTRF